jgi:HK97 gp10 family phage protein
MNVRLESYIKDVISDIDKSEKKVRSKAAQYLVKKMKEKVNDQYFKGYHSIPGEPPGKMTGNLQKGIGSKDIDSEHKTLVGVGPPAHHAHLLEFGTVERYTPVKNGKPRRSGRVAPRPFVFPTFQEEAENVGKILSERWL